MTSPILTTIGELISQNQGSIKTGPFGTTLKASEYSLTGVPVISVGEVDYGQLRLRSETPRVDINVTARLPEYLLKLGDIVFGRKGAVDRSAWVKPDESGWFLGSDGLRLRLPPSVDSKYIAYQLQMPATRAWLLQHAAGSTLLSLNQGTLARVPIVLFPLPDQRAIAEVLGALDDKIAANTKLTDHSEELMVAMVSQPGLMSPLHELVAFFRKTIDPLNIDDQLVRHFSLPAYDAGAGPEMVNPRTIKSGKFLIERPAVLVSKLNPRFPRLWDVAQITAAPSMASTEFLVLEPKFSSTAVLWSTLARPDFGSMLQTKVSGTSSSHQRVSPKDLLATEVLDPRNISDSTRARLDSLSVSARSHSEETRTLTELRDTLLPQLMSGTLRVKNAETAVEEVL